SLNGGCMGRSPMVGVSEMLSWALVFAALAVVAGYLGFLSLAGLAATVAKVVFVIFLGLLVASFVVRAVKGQSVS
ncbi:MAG TPA: DUF1328 domain-containing protein, partial [Phenylobacterium sp.]|nr:DUF1328 domain-containing protein [Phenylobacterium sp.]